MLNRIFGGEPMSQYLIRKSALKGAISVPTSKSHTMRAILFGALGKGKSIIHNYLPSTDTQAMIEACRHFGAKLEVQDSLIEITGLNGRLEHTEDVIQAGNFGTRAALLLGHRCFSC